MNRHRGSGSSDSPWSQDREQRVGEAKTPDEPMVVAAVHPTAMRLLIVRF
jgi:hypothetical protein